MTSPFLTTAEAMERYRFPSLAALDLFIRRFNAGKPDDMQIRTYKLGRSVRIDKDSFDRALIRRESRTR